MISYEKCTVTMHLSIKIVDFFIPRIQSGLAWDLNFPRPSFWPMDREGSLLLQYLQMNYQKNPYDQNMIIEKKVIKVTVLY